MKSRKEDYLYKDLNSIIVIWLFSYWKRQLTCWLGSIWFRRKAVENGLLTLHFASCLPLKTIQDDHKRVLWQYLWARPARFCRLFFWSSSTLQSSEQPTSGHRKNTRRSSSSATRCTIQETTTTLTPPLSIKQISGLMARPFSAFPSGDSPMAA